MQLHWLIAVALLMMLPGDVVPAIAQGAVALSNDYLQIEEFPHREVMVTVRDASVVAIGDLGPERFEIAESEPTPDEVALPPAEIAPEPTTTGLDTVSEQIRSTIEKRALIVVVIGLGLVLLIALLVALLVVLLRDRKAKPDAYAAVGFEQPAHPPAWKPGSADRGTLTAGPTADKTEIALTPGKEPGLGGSPFAPVTPEIPAPGGTRVIERAPKHLALLIDRSRPDHRHDITGTTNIGRSQDNHIILDDPTVSRQHAWIKSEGEGFVLFDVGSVNGTFVNDEPVDEPCHLENGDIVRFGDIEFVFTRVF